MKKEFIIKEEDFNNQIRILQIQLSEKVIIEESLKSKYSNNTKDKDEEIEKLRSVISEMRQNHLLQI